MIQGIPENKGCDEFEPTKQEQLYGRSQKFWRARTLQSKRTTIIGAPVISVSTTNKS